MREFKLAPFGGLSAAAIEAHLELYKGYTEQTTAITKQLGFITPARCGRPDSP